MSPKSETRATASPATSVARRLSVRDAGIALDAGRVILAPTDTVFGLTASAANAAALDQLWKSRGTSDTARSPLAWHLPTAGALLDVLAGAHGGADKVLATHRRLVQRLCPGPVMFAIPMSSEQLEGVRKSVNAVAGAFDDGRALLARVPNHPVTLELLRGCASPVVIAALPGLSVHPPRTAAEAWGLLERTGAAATIDGFVEGGPTPTGTPSTLIRLTPTGYEVVREGAYEERYITKRLTRTLLFVCTGNTCRSPMAEAIARHLIRERERKRPAGGVPITVRSAGISAGGGAPVTPESVDALRGIGIELPQRTSVQLSRELLADADAVFTLTASHRTNALDLDPTAADRVFVLDPEGRDVPDPIGQPQDAYDRTARRIRELVEKRLNELDW